jgi:hypothetical protein
MPQNFRTYPLSLQAGQELPFSVQGDFYAVIKAESPFTITFDESNRITEAMEGTGGRFPGWYGSVKVKSPVAQTVVIVLGFGEFWDNRASANFTVNTTVEPANKITPLAEVTIPASSSAQLAAANSNRKELRIGIKADQPGGVYLGDVNVGPAAPGGFIEEGGTDYMTTESAVYAYNAGPDPVVVHVVSLERV